MIDSHAHILAEQFDADREALIASAKESNLAWVEVGTDVAGSEKAVALAEQHANIFASVGVHPDDIKNIQDDDWVLLEKLANNPKVKAIGEVGFDTYRDGIIAEQEPVLRRFISLAQKSNKPMIFHVRSASASSTPGVGALTPGVFPADAHDELIRVLQDYSDTTRPRGVIHTFSGTQEQAQQYISLGMIISFSGVITFKNADELREIAKNIPLHAILVETDCPFLTPEPFRGKRNEPAYVKYVIQKIADIRGVSFYDIEQATEQNAKKLLALDF